MNHWTHFITEDDIANTAITGSSEVEVFHFSFNNPEALRSEIIEMLAEEAEDIAIAEQWEAERLAVCNADNEAEKAKHEVFHFSFNNPEALRSEIIEMLAEEAEDIAIAEEQANE